MSDQPIIVQQIPNPASRSVNKPIYILIAEDPGSKTKVQFYKASSVVKNVSFVEIRGVELTKAQAENVRENPNATDAGREINHEIPWQRIIRIENVTYKKTAQGEMK
jgi:hypothetical protein